MDGFIFSSEVRIPAEEMERIQRGELWYVLYDSSTPTLMTFTYQFETCPNSWMTHFF